MLSETTIRICGIIGILASLVMVVADTIFLGRWESFKQFPVESRTVGFPFWRLNIGSTLGVCLIPFVAVGFVPIYDALLPSGLTMAAITTGLLVYFIGMAPGAHVYYANNGIIQGLRKQLPAGSPEVEAIEAVSFDQRKIFMGMGYIILTAYFLGSMLYSILVAFGKTGLPIWMAFVNPFFLTAAAYTSSSWAPSVISGYLSPVSVYVGVTTLQVLTLVLMWNSF
jgi:hypothetical protein